MVFGKLKNKVVILSSRHTPAMGQGQYLCEAKMILKWYFCPICILSKVQEKAQEKKRQQVHASTSKPHTTTASGWSRRLEEEWRAFQKTYKGK